jgi:hypothetical protein
MWRFLLAALALSIICIGLDSRDRAKKESGKMYGEASKPSKFCMHCQRIAFESDALCPFCGQSLETIHEVRIHRHAIWDGFAEKKQILEERLGVAISRQQAYFFLAFEEEYGCTLYSATPASMPVYPLVKPSKQASADLNRLNFARYLVATGRLSEEIEA